VASAAGAYLAKFRPDGEVAWVRSGYGAGGVAVDQRQNIYFNSGNFHCGKFAPDGGLIWERRFSPRGDSASGYGVALTAGGEPVFVGEFEGSLQFDEHVVENKKRGGKTFIVWTGQGFVLEASTALESAAWNAVVEGIVQEDGRWMFTESYSSADQRFFRLRRQP
jgi:hypothetical protein